MSQWFDEVTLDRVAADAEVTVQTVVRRFGSKEGLLTEAAKVLATQINARRASPGADVPRLVATVVEDYEQVGDAVIRLLALESRLPMLRTVTDFGRGEHRRWVSEAFAESLVRLDATARRRAIDALIVTTDVYTWKILRRDMGHGVAAAKAVMTALVGAAVADLSKANGKGERR